VNPAPDSLLSSLPDSLVDNIPQIPMDAENEDKTKDQNKSSDTAALSKEPPQTDAGKDTCQFGCSYESASLVDSMPSISLNAENKKNTEQECSDKATLSNVPS